jgi:hypothetical protein
MTILFFSTWLVGQQIWLFRLNELPYLSFMPAWTFSRIVEVGIYVISIALSLPFSLYNMYT